MADPTVCVILLSYNRPRMLCEAFQSIRGADEIFLLDDGSEFDVHNIAKYFQSITPKMVVRGAPKMTLEQRLATARVGVNINQAIYDTDCEIITYLCDDDIFHPEWIPTIKKFFTDNPEDHIVRARWNIFKDGEPLGDRLCPLAPQYDMTTGNIAHRKKCSLECKVLWANSTVASHDCHFVHTILPAHPLNVMKKLPNVAGWRREHPYNMMLFATPQGYLPTAKEVLKKTRLE